MATHTRKREDETTSVSVEQEALAAQERLRALLAANMEPIEATRAALLLEQVALGASTVPSRPKQRLTADLPADVWDLLNVTAKRSGYNKLTTLVRAIRVFAELQEAIDDGGEIIIKDKAGKRSRLILR